MALIDTVRHACDRLAKGGWLELMARHGLNLAASNLAAELAKPLHKIDRKVHGFEDFALAGTRGIEPGQPALSLLYHALASPRVLTGASPLKPYPLQPVTLFPTLLEIEAVENYVFGVKPPTWQQLEERVHAQGLQALRRLRPVVFSCEYRPAHGTTHGKHADLVFSRTGLSHVGTAAARYDGQMRGFTPFPPAGTPAGRVCVMPARFVVYLAVPIRQTSQLNSWGVPMDGAQAFSITYPNDPTDTSDYWLPLHKLFDGPECLAGVPSHVSFSAGHLNEKIRRIHLWLQSKGLDSGQPSFALDQVPFRFEEGIADLATGPEWPPGWVVPAVHPHLVEPASFRGRPLTYRVPTPDVKPGWNPRLMGSLRLDTLADAFSSGSAPDCADIVHARTKVVEGQEVSLGAPQETDDLVRAGGYLARHYLDFTGDGWVAATWTTGVREQALPAYSVVGAPHCLPGCSQRETWAWVQGLPKKYQRATGSLGSAPLSLQRNPVNLQLPQAGFDALDGTLTAMVPLFGSWPSADPPASALSEPWRTSWLPDHSSSIEAPGWDVGLAYHQIPSGATIPHLASFRLGSPFLEDAKLCAALSSYWPTVGLDSARRYGDRSDAIVSGSKSSNDGKLNPVVLNRTVAPVTDAELGMEGGVAWDGEAAPVISQEAAGEFYIVPRFDQGDSVTPALAGQWFPGRLGKVTNREYQRRALGMAQVYLRLFPYAETTDFFSAFDKYIVIGFQSQPEDAEELAEAQRDAAQTFTETPLRFELADHLMGIWTPTAWKMKLRNRTVFYVAPGQNVVVARKPGLDWAVLPEL